MPLRRAILSRLRLPRYGLRTLFVVVTLFAVWLGWEMSFIRERKAFLSRMQEQGAEVLFADEPAVDDYWMKFYADAPTIPIWRQWLGDRPVLVPGSPIEEIMSSEWDEQHSIALRNDLNRLFPECPEYLEAEILRW